MRLLIKQRVFSWTDTFDIYDESGKPKYFVKGGYVTKEPFHWGDTYVIDFSNPEDELPALLLVLAIDAANCSNGS